MFKSVTALDQWTGCNLQTHGQMDTPFIDKEMERNIHIHIHFKHCIAIMLHYWFVPLLLLSRNVIISPSPADALPG